MTSGDHRPSSRMRLRGALVLLLALASGMLVGGALDRLYLARALGSGADEASRLDERRREERERRSDIPEQIERLGLTPVQRARIERLVERRRPEADSMMAEVLPRVRALELSMDQEMMCVLTAGQRREWVAYRQSHGMNGPETQEWLRMVTAGACPDSGRHTEP